ncbi:MAG TPA: hypothetical protein PLS53_16430 [Thermoanaerobaculaceae bacterium]|nr:hypothetical protein [Thermoanaerobaculaceae bacterium]
MPLVMLVGLASRCQASEEMRVPPPPEALKLLDLLAAGEASVETMRDVLGPVVREENGRKSGIGSILREGIRRGALRGGDVFEALAKEGCPPVGDCESNSCYHLRTRIWPYGTERGEFRGPNAPKAAPPQPSLDESRTTLMATRSDVVAGSFRVREPYVRGLVERADSPVRRAIELLMMKSLDELSSPADSALIRRFASAKTPPDEIDRWALWTLQNDLRGQLYEKFRYAKPDQALIGEVRALSPEFVDKAVNAEGVPDVLPCVFAAWRKGEQPPNEWQAWKDLLLCVGWF